MKKASVLFICMLLVGFTATAQRGSDGNRQSSPQERAERQAKVMKVDLNLDTAQYEKLLALNLKQADKASTTRAKMKEEMHEKREAIKAERDVYQTELETILTPEQFKKHETIMKERMEKRGKSRGGDRPQSRRRRN
jgi:Spy/CpxP family protein refolding chaperone